MRERTESHLWLQSDSDRPTISRREREKRPRPNG